MGDINGIAVNNRYQFKARISLADSTYRKIGCSQIFCDRFLIYYQVSKEL